MNPDDIDPAILTAVDAVANRFGADGLTAMIALAEERRRAAKRAGDELAALSSGPAVVPQDDRA